MNKYENMLQDAMAEKGYSILEKEKILYLLDYCHAERVRKLKQGYFEVLFRCDALDGISLATDTCNKLCKRCGCSTCTAAGDAEMLINLEKNILDFEPSDEFFFADEVQSILEKFRGNRNVKLCNSEIDQIMEEIKQELRCFNEKIKQED